VNVENQESTRKYRPAALVIGRSVVLGLIVGAVAAVLLTIDTTIRQPNFEPASFLIALLWIFPYLLVGALAIGALIGLASGTLASPITRPDRQRLVYVLAFLVGIGLALVLVTHPTLWLSHAVTNLIVLLVSGAIVVAWAKRVFPPRPRNLRSAR
jgi:hypothetical protein